MPTIRYIDGGRYRVDGITFEPGDEADVGEALAEHLTDRDEFELVDGEGAVVPHVSSEDIEALLDGTVVKVEEALATGEFDTVLNRVAETERGGDDRVGVHDAIAARRDEIEG
jgi:hypothetical protein